MVVSFFTTEEENAEYYAEYFVATVNIPESELIESSDKHRYLKYIQTYTLSL